MASQVADFFQMPKTKITDSEVEAMLSKFKSGVTKDKPDSRDYIFDPPKPMILSLPPSVDLSPLCPPIIDQDGLGSCVSNAIANQVLFDQMKQGWASPWLPSRLFMYYSQRALEGSLATGGDCGSSIRDGMKAINRVGYCPETDWPYTPSNYNVKPPSSCYTTALQHKSILYQRVPQNLDMIKTALYSGFPVVYSISVYDSFFSSGGVVPMPPNGDHLAGGHGVLMVGYNDTAQRFLSMNSWGAGWGLSGYFTIPYEYIMDQVLTSDLWVLYDVG
jgi:C1A family cysteine protease